MSTKSEDDLLNTLLALALLPFLVAFNGYLFSIMWGWFAVGPLGAPELRTVDALGVSCLAGWFTSHNRTKTDDKSVGKILLDNLTTMGLLFGIAAIVHAFQ